MSKQLRQLRKINSDKLPRVKAKQIDVAKFIKLAEKVRKSFIEEEEHFEEQKNNQYNSSRDFFQFS